MRPTELLAHPPYSKIEWKIERNLIKRFFDMTFSFAILIFFSPLYLIIYFAIRISSPGKAIYTQLRLGQGGKVFKCYKFRTMYQDADKRLHSILRYNPNLKFEWQRDQKLKDDPRILPLGRFLRKTSLDELPQFWNVLKGEISVVGPRPYMVSQRKELGDLATKILSVPPGITGIWQTSGRGRTSFKERIELDARYVETKSFWYDILLILKTIPLVFFPKDAC